ncbi:hypothetical protein [Streptomyces sp. NPDC057682]
MQYIDEEIKPRDSGMNISRRNVIDRHPGLIECARMGTTSTD